VYPGDERAERRPPALAARVAGDDHLLRLPQLQLVPVRRAAAGAVWRVGSLRDDAFELLLACGCKQRGAVVELRRDEDSRTATDDLLEAAPALPQRLADELLGVELEEVEEHEDGRAVALLQKREARPAAFVERADLAVENCVRCRDRTCRRSRDVTEPPREIVPVPARERHLAAGHGHDRAEAVPLRLVAPLLPERERLRGDREHGQVAAAAAARVLPEEEPVLGVSVERGRHKRPLTVQPLSTKPHREPTVALLLEQLVRPAIPDLDRARAVLPRGNDALEIGVLQRVVLDVNGEVPLALPKRDALRDRPTRERAVALEAEVVVQASCVVPLDYEARVTRTCLPSAEGFRRLSAVTLALVLVEAHLWIVARYATRSLPTRCTPVFFPA
jgi:hypothetical protein